MEEFAELYERALQSSELLHAVYVFPAVLHGSDYSEYKRVLELHPAASSSPLTHQPVP